MTLAQLTYFVALAETGSFTRAAEREHVSQPSLSQQIRALEQELGGRLVERRSDGIRLTAAGRTLLPKARAAVQATQDGRFLASQVLAEGSDALCIATVAGAPTGLLAEAVARVRRERPALAVRIHVHATHERVEEKLRDGDGALALAAPPAGDWAGPVVSLGVRELVLVVRPDDDVPDLVTPTDVGGRTLVVLEHAADRATAALAATGVEPPSLVRTDNVEVALALVGAGAGVALLDEGVLGDHVALRAARFADPLREKWALFASGAWTPPALDVVTALARLAGEPAGAPHAS